MRKETLVKCKIVAVDTGYGIDLITFMWKKWFWFIGYWYPYGVATGGRTNLSEVKNKVNDDNVSRIIYDEFLIKRT